MGREWTNPLLPGFHPDPSIIRVDATYYMVTSTFEYLPALPIYRSTDLVEWEQIGHVAPDPAQVCVGSVPTNQGVFAPTLRHREGTYYLIVTIVGSPRRCVLFTATSATGPWSHGLTIEGINGIDPDLAWADDGTAIVTFSGLRAWGPDAWTHHGIQQVRADLEAGTALEEPRTLWSGSGLAYPEAPHLYRRGSWWYLLIAEGGTERGHSISVARSSSPYGPFEGCPRNPVLSACGRDLDVQNTGHGDMVVTGDGSTMMVLLGVRPSGGNRAFSPLGRETFGTQVAWDADDWPTVQPPRLPAQPAVVDETIRFDSEALAGLDGSWLGVRRSPRDLCVPTSDGLVIKAPDGACPLTSLAPAFIGRRVRHLRSTSSVTLAGEEGAAGGLALRVDERHTLSLEVTFGPCSHVVTARAAVNGLEQTWATSVVAVEQVVLTIDCIPGSDVEGANGPDVVRLLVGGEVLAEQDGRYWSMETATSFTGRVVGPYASLGEVSVREFRYVGG